MSVHAINGMTFLGAFVDDATAEASLIRNPDAGDYYHNTTTDVLRSYDGTAWSNVDSSLTSLDKDLTSAVTSGDDSDTGLDISATPRGHVQIVINVPGAILGDGVTTKDCYFSSDGLPGGVRLIADIVAGDSFVWNGVIAGFELDAVDVVSFNYET